MTVSWKLLEERSVLLMAPWPGLGKPHLRRTTREFLLWWEVSWKRRETEAGMSQWESQPCPTSSLPLYSWCYQQAIFLNPLMTLWVSQQHQAHHTGHSNSLHIQPGAMWTWISKEKEMMWSRLLCGCPLPTGSNATQAWVGMITGLAIKDQEMNTSHILILGKDLQLIPGQ